MPPAIAAVGGPAAAASLGIGGVSLLDNLFGSGKDSRDMQQQGLDQQNQLAQAQLPEIQRQTALNQYLEDLLKEKMANPQGPEQFLDLDPVFQQFYPGKSLIDQSVYEANSPGIMSRQALDQLMGLGGMQGTSGIAGFANNAMNLGEDRRDEFSQNISDIVRTLMQSGAFQQKPLTPATPPSIAQQPQSPSGWSFM